MTERQSALLRRALTCVAIIASVAWAGFFGGMNLMWTTIFRGWFGGSYSIHAAVWLEVALFGPCAVLWTVVFIIQWLILRHQGVATATFVGTIKSTLRGAEHLFSPPGLWILAAFSVLWPALTEVPGLIPDLLTVFGVDQTHVQQLGLYSSIVLHVAMFIAPPLLLAAAIVGFRRVRLRFPAAG